MKWRETTGIQCPLQKLTAIIGPTVDSIAPQPGNLPIPVIAIPVRNEEALIGACLMAIVNGIASVLQAIIGAIASLFDIIISCLTCACSRTARAAASPPRIV